MLVILRNWARICGTIIMLSQVEGPQATNEIVKELVEKASGVFLWVVLACRSVVEGLIAYDSTADIKARVDELPREGQGDSVSHL
jgi:hypothetical protein